MHGCFRGWHAMEWEDKNWKWTTFIGGGGCELKKKHVVQNL